MRIGEWVVYNDDGLWFGFFDEHKVAYPTKTAAIEDVSAACLDTRKTPKVCRAGAGKYTYTPKDPDTDLFGEAYTIEKLTSENLARFEQLYQDTLEEQTD